MRPALSRPREIVGHEDGDMLPCLGVLHIVDRHLIHIFWRVGHLHHLYSIKTLGGGEKSVQDILKGEIGAYLVLFDIEFLFLHLPGIIVVVPGLDLESAFLGIDHGLHVGHFLMASLHGRLKHLHQQIGGGFGGLGHHSDVII